MQKPPLDAFFPENSAMFNMIRTSVAKIASLRREGQRGPRPAKTCLWEGSYFKHMKIQVSRSVMQGEANRWLVFSLSVHDVYFEKKVFQRAVTGPVFGVDLLVSPEKYNFSRSAEIQDFCTGNRCPEHQKKYDAHRQAESRRSRRAAKANAGC